MQWIKLFFIIIESVSAFWAYMLTLVVIALVGNPVNWRRVGWNYLLAGLGFVISMLVIRSVP